MRLTYRWKAGRVAETLRRLTHRSGWAWLALPLLSFILALLYSVTTPLWEAPDEPGHFGYVITLLQSHTLPVQRVGETAEAHQPPLYYALAALPASIANLEDATGGFRGNPRFIWAGQGGHDLNISAHGSSETFPFRGISLGLHLARGASALMAAITVAMTLAIGWEILPARRAIGLVGAGLVALNPQFLFISGAVNNDNLLVMASTGTWWALLRALRRPERARQWLYVGLWVALAILAKPSGMVTAMVAGLVLTGCAVARRSPSLLARGIAALALPVAILTGWWFYCNQMLYGDPMGWTVFEKVFQTVLRDGPLRWGHVRQFFAVQFRSFWGVFGWMNLLAPPWFYAFFRALMLLAVLGLVKFAATGGFRELAYPQRAALGVLALASVAQEGYLLAAITRFNASWYQGRYLFAVLVPLMTLMSLGLLSLVPRRSAPVLLAGLLPALLAVALFVPFGVIAPAYPMVPLPKSRLWRVPHRTLLRFSDMVELRGFEVREDGENAHVRVTLYWKALGRPDFDYSAFVHLLDEAGALVAQKDHAPGESVGYPPTAWWPGDIIADEHLLKLPPGLAPGTYHFRVGLYDWETGERVPITTDGEPAGAYVILDETWSR